MRALVTGGTGFIGSYLVDTLILNGFDVSCFVRKNSNLQWLSNKPIQYIYCDIRDKECLKKYVREVEYIFHIAGLVKAKSFEEYLDANHIGTKNIVEASLYNRNLKRFVYVSSLSVAGPSQISQPATESSLCYPISEYGLSKYKGEIEVLKLAKHMSVTIIRPPIVYGPRDTGVYLFFKIANLGILPSLGVRRYFSHVYIKNLIDGILLGARHPNAEGKIYFITDNGYHSFDELMYRMSLALGKTKAVHIHIPETLLSAVSSAVESIYRLFGKTTFFNREKAMEIKAKHWICSNELAKKELGFNPKVTMEEGIEETAKWYKKAGWL